MEDAVKLRTRGPDSHGLWVNEEYREGDPGTFAVIIGISRYPYLAGGQSAVKQTYGLGQLAVSALTGFEVFRWLRSRYRLHEAPLAKCWLLLSPTEDEIKFEPRLTPGQTDASFNNCYEAIVSWWASMRDLSAKSASKSRAIFFFSGHGIEMHQEQQILLPSDYLRPPAGNVNAAISTQNLKSGLASLNVPCQLFFLDACRNGDPELRKNLLTGTPILNEGESSQVNPDLIAPLLYAAASGQQAFQQPEPSAGLSLFGRALIDGLGGKPDIDLLKAGDEYAVNLYSLQGFLKQRVIELLEEEKETVRQSVKLSGSVDNIPITFLHEKTVRAVRSVVEGFGRRTVIPPSPKGYPPMQVDAELIGRGERLATELDSRYRISRDLDDKTRDLIKENSYEAHDAVGSERVTWLLSSESLRAFALGSKRWIPYEAVLLKSIERDDGSRSYRFELEITESDEVGYWLQVGDTEQRSFACVLPNLEENPLYLLELDFNNLAHGRELARFEAFLSTQNEWLLGSAAELWRRYSVSDVEEASHALTGSPLEHLEELLKSKLSSPLAATTAALIMLRVNRFDLLHDWLKNLTDWFPGLPDGPVLWAEQLRRQAKPCGTIDASGAGFVAMISERGLPFTSEGFGYAANLLETCVRTKPLQELNPLLEELQSKIYKAMVYFRPGGLFSSFVGFDPKGSPLELIGPLKR